ncbi:MAG TPA: hypothetical protein PKX92_04435 [Edaphocola sp.]|nr:hypothetical protein [Edaphocola sp.]
MANISTVIINMLAYLSLTQSGEILKCYLPILLSHFFVAPQNDKKKVAQLELQWLKSALR